MILPSRALLDPGRDVDRERAERAHHVAHALRPEAAGDEEPSRREAGGRRGLECDARAPRAASDEAVDQEIVHEGREPPRLGDDVGARGGADRLDDAPRPAAAVVWVLVAVELHRGEPDPPRHLLDARAGRVDEDADERRSRHGVGDLGRELDVDAAWARGVEVEPEEVGAGPRGGDRVVDATDATDLDLHGHRSHSASAAPGSAASMNASPTSTACAPALTILRTSSAERMPLSATTS